VTGTGRLHRALVTTSAGVLALAGVLLPATAAAAVPPRSGIVVESAVVDSPAIPRGTVVPERCGLGGLNHPTCGLGSVEFTLSGFDAYGGVPECDGDECANGLADLVDSAAGTRMDLLVRCAGDWRPQYRSVPVVTQGYSSPSSVDGRSRLDSDTVRVTAFFTVPGGADLHACPEDATVVLGAVLRTVSMSFEPTEAGRERGLTAWTSTSWRPFPVPSSD
jgi:hypothetical protein